MTFISYAALQNYSPPSRIRIGSRPVVVGEHAVIKWISNNVIMMKNYLHRGLHYYARAFDHFFHSERRRRNNRRLLLFFLIEFEGNTARALCSHMQENGIRPVTSGDRVQFDLP